MTWYDELSSKRLCFSVTAGRTGTTLLTRLLSKAAGLTAEHEPPPLMNFVLRSFLDCPGATEGWLRTEKFPAIAATAAGKPSYAELSHLTCKAFIEPMLDLGLRPAFLMIMRPARDVATSLYGMNVVPERTEAGRLVLVSPRYSKLMAISDWQGLSDYQLCYWYAKEIEARQAYYRAFFDGIGIEWMDVSLENMVNLIEFGAVANFVAGHPCTINIAEFEQVVAVNQNPRSRHSHGSDRLPPDDREGEEAEVLAAIARLSPQLLDYGLPASRLWAEGSDRG